MVKDLVLTERKIVEQKLKRIAEMMLEDSADLLDEVLSLIFDCFEDAELTIFDQKKQKVVSSTVKNVDILDALQLELQSVCFLIVGSEPMHIIRGESRKLRPGVRKLTLVPLYTSSDKTCLLCVEYFSKNEGITMAKLMPIFEYLTVAVRLYNLSQDRESALDMDRGTGLLGRDALIDRLKKLSDLGVRCMCLGVISISNVCELNKTRGMRETDVILRAVASTLQYACGKDSVFRISGTKFAVIFTGKIDHSSMSLESLIDRVLSLDKEIVTANVLTSVRRGDPYEPVYVCESHLKTAQTDVVTVVRHAADIDFMKEYEEVSETYFARDIKAASVDTVEQQETEVGNELKDIGMDESEEENTYQQERGQEDIIFEEERVGDETSYKDNKNDFITSMLDDVEPPDYALSDESDILEENMENKEKMPIREQKEAEKMNNVEQSQSENTQSFDFFGSSRWGGVYE